MVIKILFILGIFSLSLSFFATLLNHLGLASKILDLTFVTLFLGSIFYFIKLYEKN